MRSKWYVGFRKFYGRVMFQSIVEPTAATHGNLYGFVLGPFRTKRVASYAANLDEGKVLYSKVGEYERAAKIEEEERVGKFKAEFLAKIKH